MGATFTLCQEAESKFLPLLRCLHGCKQDLATEKINSTCACKQHIIHAPKQVDEISDDIFTAIMGGDGDDRIFAVWQVNFQPRDVMGTRALRKTESIALRQPVTASVPAAWATVSSCYRMCELDCMKWTHSFGFRVSQDESRHARVCRVAGRNVFQHPLLWLVGGQESGLFRIVKCPGVTRSHRTTCDSESSRAGFCRWLQRTRKPRPDADRVAAVAGRSV